MDMQVKDRRAAIKAANALLSKAGYGWDGRKVGEVPVGCREMNRRTLFVGVRCDNRRGR